MPDPISFGVSNLVGELSNNPTAIDFSKTGNPTLFVAQQNGHIYRYEIERQSDGPDADTTDDFVATDVSLIDGIQKFTQNFNDDGSVNTSAKRQVTGMAVTQDEDGNDVLYVSSSDWRIAVGTDTGLDTNSGQIHKIVVDPDTGEVLSNVAIVRGLPRSEENHSTNGVDIAVDPITGHTFLWLAIGGITNKGAPGNNFAGTVDFALAGAIIKVDLTELESYDTRTDANGDQFILDLSTLDDPTRPNVDLSTLNIQNLAADPNFTLDDNGSINGVLAPDWAGGNNGLNQAKISENVLVSQGGQLTLVSNPLAIHAPGFRNPYDVLITEDGQVYSWDNGPNSGWGGPPISYQDGQIVDDWTTDLATNLFNEAGSQAYGDQLHYLGNVSDLYGPYGGHANPIRAAKAVLDAAFNTDGTYKGASATDPIIANGSQLFANEADARTFLESLLIIYEEQGDGNWVDVSSTTGLPPDLFDVISGYDWKQPGSSISNPLAFFDGTSVQDGTVYSPESQLFDFAHDGSLVTTPETTNGLAEYRASFFGGVLQGAIIGASFDETLYFAKPIDTDGDGRIDAASIIYTLTDFGSNPLAVAALPDWGLSSTLIDNNGDGLDDFAGLIVAANYGNDNVVFFVPGGAPLSAGNDLDLDGLDNIVDSHVGDPLNGRGVVVGSNQSARWDFELNNPSSTPPGAVPTGNSIAGDIGINAVWRNNITPGVSNGGDPSQGLYDGGVLNLGGASSFVSIDRAFGGNAEGPANSQQDVLGIGFVSQGAESLTITTEMSNIFTYSINTDSPARTWDGGEKVGLMVGPGDQSNFVEAVIAVINDNGTIRYGVLLVSELNDVFTTSFTEIPGIENPTILGLGDPNFQVAIDIDLSSGNETAVARARYVDNGIYTEWVSTDALSLAPAVVQSLKGEYNNLGATTGAVVGLLSSTNPGDDSFAASWDWVDVENFGSDNPIVHRWVAGNNNVNAIDDGPNWISDPSVVIGGPTRVTTHDIPTLDTSVPSTTPIGIYAQERWDPASGQPMQLEFAVDPGDYAIRLYLGNGATGTNAIGDRIFDVLIEGQVFLDNVDLVASFGHDVGGMFEWTGTIDDGIADIDFQAIIQNPLINAVEIIKLIQPGPIISISDAQANEGAGTVTVSISADTTIPTDNDVLIQYQVRPLANGATPEVDYTVAGATYNAQTGVYSGSTEMVGGSSDLSITITVLNDSINETDEAFEVTITSVLGGQASIGDGTGVVTILDDDAATGTGAVTLAIRETSNDVQVSNFGVGSFVLTNVGDKVVTQVQIDVTNAVLTDAIFDPFGVAGDSVSKPITIDSNGGTGIIAPTAASYIGAGGIQGYEGIVLSFNQGVNGGFQTGETVTFSVDMDPNSVAGAKKSVLELGSNPNWDVGGVSGAELIGSTFTVTYADGSTSTGMLQGTNTQGGAKGISSQSSPGTQASLEVNGLVAGGVGTYNADTFNVIVDGPAGSVMRVVLVKGIIQPITNEFYNGNASEQAYAPQLDAQLDALRASNFAANNAAEVQTVDITLTGSPQDISSFFDISGVAAYNFSGEDEVPLALVASIIDPLNGNLPLGSVTSPIYLKFDSEASDNTAPMVQSVTAADIGAADLGTATTTVTVVFADNLAIDVSSIDIADITVTGPAGPLNVTGVSVSTGSDGSPRAATYTIAAPGGTWDATDTGSYTVSLAGGQVLDTSGNAVAANPQLTTFEANFSTQVGDPFRIEAETFTITQGFVVKNNANASADQYLQAGSSAEQVAHYTFAADAGTYNLEIGYYDEADGQSQLSVRLNGVEIDNFVWNADPGGNNANGDAFTTHILSGINFAAGDVLELAGFSNAGEPLRIDYVEFTPLGGDPIAPSVQSASAPDIDGALAGTTTTNVTVVYADNVAVDLSSIDISDISVTGPGGTLSVTGVSVNSGTDGSPLTATYTVAAPGGTWDAADDGSYNVALIGGSLVDTSGNPIAAQSSLASFAVDLAPTPPGPDPFRIEAEALSLTQGFVVKTNNNASSDMIIQATGSGVQTASMIFAEVAGTYDIALGYYDEADGQSQLSVLLNGAEIDSFVWNVDAGGNNANGDAAVERILSSVQLNAGDVLTLTGTPNSGEPLRLDYLDFNYVDELLV